MPNILLFILLIILILVISFIIINSFGINSATKYSKKIGGSEIVTIPANATIFPQSYGEQNTDVKTINYAKRLDGKKLIIGKKSFMNANELTELKVPNFITLIDNEAFMGCTLLASIIFEDRPNNYDYKLRIGNNAFKDCISLTELNIPNFIKEINSEAFMGCTSLSSIIFEDSAIQSYNSIDYRLIMRNAFKNCSSLTNVHNFPPIANFYKNIIFDNTKIDKIIAFTYDNPAIVMQTYLNILNDLISNVLRTNKIDKIESIKVKFLLVEFQKFLSLSNTELYNIIKLHNNIEAIINLITITISNISKIKNLDAIYKTTLNEILQFFIKQQNLDILNNIIQEFESDSEKYLLEIVPELQKDDIDDKMAFIIDLFKIIYKNREYFYYGTLLEMPIQDFLDGMQTTLNNINKLKNINRNDELYNIVQDIRTFCIHQQSIDEQNPQQAAERQEAERQRVAELVKAIEIQTAEKIQQEAEPQEVGQQEAERVQRELERQEAERVQRELERQEAERQEVERVQRELERQEAERQEVERVQLRQQQQEEKEQKLRQQQELKKQIGQVEKQKRQIGQVDKQQQSINKESITQQIQQVLQQKEKNGKIFIKKEENTYNDDSDYGIDMSPSAQIQKFIKEHTITKIKLINPHNIPDKNISLNEFEMKFKGNTYIPHCEIYATNGDIYKND